MLGILFLAVSIWLGVALVRVAVPDMRKLFSDVAGTGDLAFVPSCLFVIPAGITTGIIVVTFFSYYLTLAASMFSTNYRAVRAVCLLVTALLSAAVCLILELLLRKRQKHCSAALDKTSSYDRANNLFYILSIVVMTILVGFIMLDSCRMKSGDLLIGLTVSGDFGPHTAIMSSFAKGFNFPTQYPHFAADGVQYHFLFFYFCGTLQYLGMPMDWAINLPSILTMVSTLTLTGLLAALFARRRSAFAVAPALVLFRSSFNFFFQFAEALMDKHSLTGALASMFRSRSYYGKTEFESYGVWTINIYGNQRHFMLGIACVLILVFLFFPYVRRMCAELDSITGTKDRLCKLFLSKESWLPSPKALTQDAGRVILGIFLLAAMPYFHGSSLISALLVLAGLALFSQSRLIYLLAAVIAFVSAEAQSALFSGSGSNVLALRFAPGFCSDEKNFMSITMYLILITGLTLFAALWYMFQSGSQAREKKQVSPVVFFGIASFLPLVFAFLFQVTAELITNHKFVQITLILLDVLVACFVVGFLRPVKSKKGTSKKYKGVGAVAAWMVLLTISSIFEWATYINFNADTVKIDTHSEMVEWICEHTDPKDVFLTPEWSLNKFFLSGRMAYYGYYSYAWSAGFDTDSRSATYSRLVSGCGGDVAEFREICREEGIRYVIDCPAYEKVSEKSSFTYDSSFFEENLTLCARFDDEGISIYLVEE